MNLKEIAAVAQVSQSTVTLVLHDRPGVSEKTKQRVRRLLLENGYAIKSRENEAAEDGKEHHSIVLLKYRTHAMLTDGNHGFVSKIIDGLESECKKFNFDLVFNIAEPDRLAASIEEINRKKFKGVILLGTEFRSEYYHHLKKLEMPIVAVDNAMDNMPVSSVSNNPPQSTRAVIEYYRGRGHETIGFLRNIYPTTICDGCFQGYLDNMKSLGLAVKEDYIFDIVPTFDGAYESMKTYLQQGRELPSALMSNIDIASLGVLKAFKEFGVEVPKNVSLIGADNIINTAFSDPPLTTLETFVDNMGKWAVTLLHNKINNPDAPVMKLHIDTKLIERDSVCDFADYVPFENRIKSNT